MPIDHNALINYSPTDLNETVESVLDDFATRHVAHLAKDRAALASLWDEPKDPSLAEELANLTCANLDAESGQDIFQQYSDLEALDQEALSHLAQSKDISPDVFTWSSEEILQILPDDKVLKAYAKAVVQQDLTENIDDILTAWAVNHIPGEPKLTTLTSDELDDLRNCYISTYSGELTETTNGLEECRTYAGLLKVVNEFLAERSSNA